MIDGILQNDCLRDKLCLDTHKTNPFCRCVVLSDVACESVHAFFLIHVAYHGK